MCTNCFCGTYVELTGLLTAHPFLKAKFQNLTFVVYSTNCKRQLQNEVRNNVCLIFIIITYFKFKKEKKIIM